MRSWRVQNLALAAHHLPVHVKMLIAVLAYWAEDDGTGIRPSIESIAERAGRSERQIKRVIKQMREAGVLIEVRPARQHHPAEYRIDLARLAPPHTDPIGIRGDICVTPETSVRGDMHVTAEEARGDMDGRQGCHAWSPGVTCMSPNNTKNKYQDTHQSRARKDLDKNREDKTEFQPSLMLTIPGHREITQPSRDRWPDICEALWSLPGVRASASVAATAAAVRRLLASGAMTAEELLDCIGAHAEALAASNAARGRSGLETHPDPVNWIERDRGWERYLPRVRDGTRLPKRVVETRGAAMETVGAGNSPAPEISDEDRARLRKCGIPDAESDAWFAAARFAMEGRRLVVAVERPFTRNWIATHFAARLERGWDCDEVEVRLADKVGRAA